MTGIKCLGRGAHHNSTSKRGMGISDACGSRLPTQLYPLTVDAAQAGTLWHTNLSGKGGYAAKSRKGKVMLLTSGAISRCSKSRRLGSISPLSTWPIDSTNPTQDTRMHGHRDAACQNTTYIGWKCPKLFSKCRRNSWNTRKAAK